MPYKASGTNVMIKKEGRWVLFMRHKTKEAAMKFAKALNANVRHK